MDKEELAQYLRDGLTTRDIQELVPQQRSTIAEYTDPLMFRHIDSPEKAYILGFILADAHVDDKSIEISVALGDREILDYIQSVIGGNIRVNKTLNRKTRRFPRARMHVANADIVRDVRTKIGGLKSDRRFPIIPHDLERYLILGFFDGDGCITWGRRKDRNRIWHKITFNSSYKLLEGVQKILLKQGISTAIRPKSDEKCFVMEFANKPDVLKFLDYIYDDEFIVLKRKYKKAIALRLELGEFSETYVREGYGNTKPSLQSGKVQRLLETGDSLNDQIKRPSLCLQV